MSEHHQRRWRNNQMAAALWRHAVTSPHWGADPDQLVSKPPRTFTSRIKKLKNLDRMPSMAPSLDLPEGCWVFYDQPGEGAGSEEFFSTLHVFLMGIALDLLDLGLKQAEVIFVLKHARPKLEAVFDQIVRPEKGLAPIHGTARQRCFHKHYPQSQPIHVEGTSAPQADFTVWMLIRRFENKDIYPAFVKKAEDQKLPFFMEPEFFEGLEALKNHIFTHVNGHRRAVLIELADLARTLPSYLAEAPSIGRGRPAREEMR